MTGNAVLPERTGPRPLLRPATAMKTTGSGPPAAYRGVGTCVTEAVLMTRRQGIGHGPQTNIPTALTDSGNNSGFVLAAMR